MDTQNTFQEGVANPPTDMDEVSALLYSRHLKLADMCNKCKKIEHGANMAFSVCNLARDMPGNQWPGVLDHNGCVAGCHYYEEVTK